MGVYARRRIVTGIVMGLAVAATAFGVLWLVLVLWTLLENGIAAITPAMFSQMTPPPGSAGGLLNAIFGSVVMTLIATLIGTPTGILAGTFLAEYSRGSRFGEVVRFINDILLSAPSIVVGLFVYELVVVRMGHFSAWAGAVALAIIVVPVVVRTSEDMLNLVGAWLAKVEGDRDGLLPGGDPGHADRRDARCCAHCRRDGSIAFHGPQ
jgi:phosphate transport system permease protein